MKKVLITGSSGFIGYHLTDYILKNNLADVYGLDIKEGAKFHKEAGFEKIQSYDEISVQDSLLQLHDNPLGIILVAWNDEEKFVGIVAGGIYPNFYNPRETVAHVGFICIELEHRKGIATGQLMDAFEQWALDMGANSLAYASNTKEWSQALKERGFMKSDTIFRKKIGE